MRLYSALLLFFTLVLIPDTCFANRALRQGLRSARGAHSTLRYRAPRPQLRRFRAPRRMAGTRGRFRGHRLGSRSGRGRVTERGFRQDPIGPIVGRYSRFLHRKSSELRRRHLQAGRSVPRQVARSARGLLLD